MCKMMLLGPIAARFGVKLALAKIFELARHRALTVNCQTAKAESLDWLGQSDAGGGEHFTRCEVVPPMIRPKQRSERARLFHSVIAIE